MANAKVQISMQRVATELAADPVLRGKANITHCSMVLCALGNMLRAKSAKDALILCSSIIDQAGREAHPPCQT